MLDGETLSITMPVDNSRGFDSPVNIRPHRVDSLPST